MSSSWLYLDDYPFNTEHASTTSSNPDSNLWFDNINYKDPLSSNTNFTDISGFEDFLFDDNNNTSSHQVNARSTSSSSSPVLPHTPTDIINSFSGPFVGDDEFGVGNADQYTATSQSLYIPHTNNSMFGSDFTRPQYSPTVTDTQNSSFSSFSMDFDFKGPLMSSVPGDDLNMSISTILPPSPKSNASPMNDVAAIAAVIDGNAVTSTVATNISTKSKKLPTRKPSTPSTAATVPPATSTSATPPSPPARQPRKHSESRMSLPELYNLMGLGNNPTEARIRERRILELLQKEGFLLGQRTWIRDTEQSQRERIINNIFEITNKDYHYKKDLIELIIRRGTYYVMQGRLRRLRRKRAQEQSNLEDNNREDTV